jgi:hypothetical protein
MWLAYVQSGVFRGGCFFAAVAAEFDSRPGPVRDRIAEIMKEWLATLRTLVVEAQNAGHLQQAVDATQLAFEVNSLELGANWAFQLYGDPKAVQTRSRSDPRTLEPLCNVRRRSAAVRLPNRGASRARA